MSQTIIELTERYRLARRGSDLAVLEGIHALKHALRFGATVVDARTPDRDALGDLAEELAPDIASDILESARATRPEVFASLAPSPHPTGVIALARRPAVDLPALFHAPDTVPIVLLERPTHHGNIGAVVRVAAAAGAAGVLVTGPHDPWHPTSIRGGAGLQFALPVAPIDPDSLDDLLGSDRPFVALDPDGDPLLSDPSARLVPPRAALVFGSERVGVSPALLERCDRHVSIPMRPGVSSLNLATAVAVTLYVAGVTGSSYM